MRLALVRQDFVSEGAVERMTEPALEALLERNVAVSLYTRSWPDTRLQLVEPVICNPFHLGALWRDWGFARATCKDIRRAQPSLVESHERMLCCDVYRAGEGVWAVWLEQRLKQASARGRMLSRLSLRNRYLLAMEKRLYASPWLRAVICNSKMVSDEIHERFGVARAKLHIVYNSVDGEHFHPGLRAERAQFLDQHRIAAGATVFVLPASDFSRCNVGAAIAALSQVAAPAHLVVAGDDRVLDRSGRCARSFGVAERVTLIGATVDPRRILGAADAFALPSLYDPSPTTALQAMACGLPVVTSNKSGAAELVREHDAGFVCASDDISALAANMRALLDTDTRTRMGANARRAVLPLSPSAITLRLVLLYRDLLAAMTQPQGV